MIRKTIDDIESKLENIKGMNPEKKAEILSLLDKLDQEVASLPDQSAERAETISRFTELSAHEATRQEPDAQLLDITLSGLTKSVDGFEASHPNLVQLVNSFCNMLSNIGI